MHQACGLAFNGELAQSFAIAAAVPQGGVNQPNLAFTEEYDAFIASSLVARPESANH